MYFPYLRGRQYELIALRELVTSGLLGNYIVPVIEPVKLSPTLVSTILEFIKANHPVAIVRNPTVGTFMADLESAQKDSKEDGYRQQFLEQYYNPLIIKSLIMQEGIESLIESLDAHGVDKKDLLVINIKREQLDLYKGIFKTVYPRYVMIPNEDDYKKRIHNNKILIADRFKKQNRNADYKNVEDEFFSKDHLYYQENGYIGFSDYSIIGDEYSESGFAPHAVAIHIVYFKDDMTLNIKHFVSDSNESTKDPALKFYQAVSKLVAWYQTSTPPVEMTLGLKTFLKHYREQSFPGHGSIKKLSLMHHFELMGNYLAEAQLSK